MTEDFSQLKEGDEVFISNRNYHLFKRKIDKITPSGKIKIGETYYKNGHEVSKDSWNRASLTLITEESIAQYNRQNILGYLSKVEFSKLENQDLFEIYGFIKNRLKKNGL